MTARSPESGTDSVAYGARSLAAPRVLHVVLDLHEGGLERLVVDLVKSSSKTGGAKTKVLCLNRLGRLADELPADCIAIAEQSGTGSLLLPLRLAAQIRRADPDVVHLHSGVWMKGAYASRLAGVRRVVFTDHGRAHPDPMINRFADRLGAACTDRVVAVSEALASYLHDRLHIPQRKICVIPNGVTLPGPVSPEEMLRVRDELGLAATTPILGAVGRLDSVKAYDLLIDALAVLRARTEHTLQSTVLLVVGDGPERDYLKSRSAAQGLAGSVRFMGWRRDVARLLSVMDVFVLCSDSEGTSLALLEAMAASRPVVATAVGGTPAVLGHVLAGQLVPPRNLNKLVELLSAMLSDRERRDHVGRLARQVVVDSYTVDGMTRRYHDLYGALHAS